MTKPIVCEKTISYEGNRYRVDNNGNWNILMFGTFSPKDNGIPVYKMVPIPENTVPKTVRTLNERNI